MTDKLDQEAITLMITVHREMLGLRKMEIQLDEKQAKSLIAGYGFDAVLNQLRRMDNWKNIASKNRSVYLTCMKWFEMDIKKGFLQRPAAMNHGTDSLEARKQEFLKKYPVRSVYTTKSGNKYEVITDTILRNMQTNECIPIVSFISKK